MFNLSGERPQGVWKWCVGSPVFSLALVSLESSPLSNGASTIKFVVDDFDSWRKQDLEIDTELEAMGAV